MQAQLAWNAQATQGLGQWCKHLTSEREALVRRVRALETSVTEATQAAKGTREELSVFKNQVVLTVDQLQKNNKVTQSMVDS